MSIISSSYTEGPLQGDGRYYVKEVHLSTSGKSYEFEWLRSTQDIAAVLAARVQVLNEQLAAESAALLVVQGTMLPLTKLKFRELFTFAERMAIDAFHLTFETSVYLTAEQKSTLRTGLEDYKMAENIARPFDARVLSMLGMYSALGLITPARMAEIVSAGNA